MENIGSLCFGLVIGWITYRTLRRKEGNAAISDIAAIIGAIGGAGITTLFTETAIFSSYCIGLAIGFFGYFIIGIIVGKGKGPSWMIDDKNGVDSWMGRDEDRGE